MKILHGGCLPHEFIFDVFFSNIVYNSEYFFNFLSRWSSGLKSKSYSIIGQKFGKMLNIIMEFWEIKSTFAGGGGYLPFVKPFGVKITLDYRPKYPKNTNLVGGFWVENKFGGEGYRAFVAPLGIKSQLIMGQKQLIKKMLDQLWQRLGSKSLLIIG